MTCPERDDADSPVSVALALLDQHWMVCSALTDQVHAGAVSELENDPRYLIGRFQQALPTGTRPTVTTHYPARSAPSAPRQLRAWASWHQRLQQADEAACRRWLAIEEQVA